MESLQQQRKQAKAERDQAGHERDELPVPRMETLAHKNVDLELQLEALAAVPTYRVRGRWLVIDWLAFLVAVRAYAGRAGGHRQGLVGMDAMMALSIQQPWADLILFGGKDIENRTWPLPDKMRGQRIYVHAGKKIDLDAPLRFCAALAPNPDNRLGAIIGEVTIVGYIDDVTETPNLSEWFEGPYGFVLADPKAYEKPIPCRGRLGFFELPEGTL